MATKGKRQVKKPRRGKVERETDGQSVDQKLIKALNHPLRVQILAVLNARMASPKELSKDLGEVLGNVSYHVRVLKDYEYIELVNTEPRRGTVEHFYKAKDEVLIPSWTLKLLPKSAQRAMFSDVLDDIERNRSESLQRGTSDKRSECVVCRDQRTLDGKAREEAKELSAEFFERYRNLGMESDRRAADGESDGELIPTTAVVLVFDSRMKPES